jgi:hypothetical protein
MSRLTSPESPIQARRRRGGTDEGADRLCLMLKIWARVIASVHPATRGLDVRGRESESILAGGTPARVGLRPP